MRKVLAALALAMATITSMPTLAATLTVSAYPGFSNVWFTNVGTDAGMPGMGSFPAALLEITVASEKPLPAYRAQQRSQLATNLSAEFSDNYAPTGNEDRAIQDLFQAFYFHSLESVARSAGFQLALWELVYDDDQRVRDRAGRLAFQPEQRRDRTARAALLWADYYLRNFERVAEGSPVLTVQWWRSEGRQDLITARVVESQPVPLPAPLVLLGSALVGLLGFRSRQAGS